MPQYRCTAYFNCKGAGWSHTFYLSEPTLGAAQKKWEIYIDKHMLLMSSQVACNYYRISNVDDRKVAVLVNTDFTGAIDSPADMPWTGIMVDLRTSDNEKRKIVLHGVPDEVTSQPWTARPIGPMFNNPYVVWKNWILANQLYLRVQNPTGVYKDIDAIVIDVNGHVKVTTTAAHGFSANPLLRFLGVRTVPGLSGTWRSVKVDATSVYLPKTNMNHIAVIGNGKVKELAYSYHAINQTQALRPAKRDLGRPFDPQHGFKKGAKIHASP